MLRLDGGASWPCIIADYCSEGMFIKYAQSVSIALDSYFKASEERGFVIIFTGQQGEQYELASKPAHVMESAAGIRFVGRNHRAIQSLNEFNAERHQCVVPEGEVRQIIRECIDCIQEYTQPLMSDFFPGVVQEIKTSAVSASSDQLANTIMESANKISREQNSMLQVFMTAIQDPKMALEKTTSSKIDTLDDLSLIGKNEFEDWLTSRVLITKTETSFRSLLLPLKIRLDAIGVGDKRYHQSPFGPALLVSAFQSSLSRLAMGSAVERLVFRCFEKQVVEHLEPLYEKLNKLLVKHNVLPDLDISKVQPLKSNSVLSDKERADKESVVKEEATKTPVQETMSSKVSVPEESAPGNNGPIFSYGAPPSNQYVSSGRDTLQHPPSLLSAEAQSIRSALPPFSSSKDAEAGFQQNHQAAEQAFQNVLGLVRSLRTNQNASDAAQGIVAPIQTYSESELSQGLSELQVSSAETEQSTEDRSSLLERVQSSLVASNSKAENAEGKGIHENQQVAIDVVDRFFASMQKNPRLSDEAKQHLLKLEVPVLKVLIKDERFFDDRNSSVRAVMNRIAQLGASGSRMSPSIRKKVDNLVKTVVKEFEHDTEVFDRVLKEMDVLVERQNQLYVKNVERVAAAAEGVHKVEEAKMAVAKALNQRLKHHTVPPAVLTLIENGWQDLLQLIHIKQGEGSLQWQDALSVIDALIAFGDEPNRPFDMKLVLPKIQAGLKLVSGNEEPSALIRDALKILMKSGPSGTQTCIQAKVKDIPETDNDLVRRNTKTSQKLKHWILRAKSFQPGIWVQFTREDNNSYYMRLVWVAKGYSKFVFVNHQGMKVVELGLFKLASYLKNKQVVPDASYEVPIVNQSLDDMVKGVYEKLAYDSSHDSDTGLANKREFCRQVREVMKDGSRTSACHLFYVRFDFLTGTENSELPAKFSVSVSKILSEAQGKTSVIGRIDVGVFVLFSVLDEQELKGHHFDEQFTRLCQETLGLQYVIGESRAHLGFHNPELMIDHAYKSVNDKISKEKRSQVESPLPRLENEEQENEVDDLDKIPVLDQVYIDETSTQESAGLEGSEGSPNLGIYFQKIIPVSESAIYGDQHELVCSVVDSGVSYEPESEEEICLLDRWWIQQLMFKKAHHEPVWDEIQTVHIKLSAYAFKDDSFKDWLLTLVDEQRLDAEHVWFDLYDCSEIENIHAAADMMKHLSVKGFHFCLDNFGTSRSPFALLKALPVDMIKIDESFMQSMNEEDADEAAADSIAEVAHYLGKEVTACSVDTAICFQRMKQLGIDYVQGTTVSEYKHLDVVIAPMGMMEN